MYIMIHRTGKDLPDASAEYACRVMAEVTGKELISLANGLLIKVPDSQGDAKLISEFWKYHPKFVVNYSRIPDEKEGAEFINAKLGGVTKMGYRFITDVLEDNRVKYDLIDKQHL